ncbi:MAG: RidA family protein [Ignavibacteriota bacterium]
MKTIITPPELVAPIGYSHAIAASGGSTIYLAGQVSFDSSGKIVHKGDLIRQFEQVLHNLKAVMTTAGGAMTDIVKLNIFVRDKNEYAANMKEIGKIYLSYFGKYFPAMTLAEVSSLFEEDALLEIEGIAVIHS